MKKLKEIRTGVSAMTTQGAINMIVEQKIPLKKVSAELGISTDSLRTLLRNAN